MLNTNISSREAVPYEKTIIEKRAPTDESIKLFKEMQEKAYSSIVDTFHLSSTVLDVKVIVFQDYPTFQMVVKYVYILNDKSIGGDIRFDMFEFQTTTRAVICERIVKEVANHLAVKLIQDLRLS